jgi:hypothetical protein
MYHTFIHMGISIFLDADAQKNYFLFLMQKQ